jgi:hypothetical protein
MSARDNCITAINKYIKNHDMIMNKFNSEYESTKTENKRLTDLNEQNQKDYATKRAAYQKTIQEKILNDEANNTNCGSNPDPTKWVYVNATRPNIFSKWICNYRYNDDEINRLMSVWDDENKFVPHTIPPLPTPPSDTVNLNCCSNKIELSGIDMAKEALQNVEQKCNQSITNNNRDGGNGNRGNRGNGNRDGGDSRGGNGGNGGNKNPNSETSTTDQNAKKRKTIIIILLIFLFIVLLLAIGVGVYLVYK